MPRTLLTQYGKGDAGDARGAFPQRSSSAATESRASTGGGTTGITTSAQTLLEARRGESRFYTDIADGLRVVCRTDTEALAEMVELHLRILFTILVSNNDDHLKNHGLLYAGEGSWALAPAFDINPQPFRHRELKTGISEIGGFDASVEGWVEAAPFFERTEDEARRQAAAMAEAISSRWRSSLLVNGLTEDQCDEYAPAFEHEETRVALGMGSPSVAVTGRTPDKKTPSSHESQKCFVRRIAGG